jgi:hypothetical protein
LAGSGPSLSLSLSLLPPLSLWCVSLRALFFFSFPTLPVQLQQLLLLLLLLRPPLLPLPFLAVATSTNPRNQSSIMSLIVDGVNLDALNYTIKVPYNGTVATGGDSLTGDLNVFYDVG